jgi:N-acyl-D-aspartate/D-glutamate deacylase
MLDLVIKGGTVVDGLARPGFHADVGVSGEHIVAIGRISTPARRTIDAQGLLVTPGFVDIHTHFDGQASWDSELAPSCHNGVTSVVMGNCGVGFAPAHPDRHDWLIGLLEGVEDIPGTALAEGIRWEWESFPQYLDALSTRRYTMDLGAYLPHAALRTYVMGDAGADFAEHPDPAQISTMADLTREALTAGAIGFSTSRTEAHKTRDGANLGTLRAGERELLGIAQALRDAGRGAIQMISDAYQSLDEGFVDSELRLIRELAELSGRPTSFTLMQSPLVPTRWRRLLAAAHAMRRGNLSVRPQVAPRPVGVILGFASSVSPFVITATCRRLMSLPFEARLAALRQADVRAAIIGEFHESDDGFWDFSRMFRIEDPVDYEPWPERSLAAEAERAGHEPADHLYDVLLEQEGRNLVMLAALNFNGEGVDAIFEMLSDRNVLFGLSDAGAHVGTISDGSFPTTTLSLWGKGSREGFKIPIETLVHGYTQRNAAHVGWTDRGVVAPGYLADLNLIDFDALAVRPPQIVHDLPAGGSRLLQAVRGYRATIKRGHVTVLDGELTGERPGRLVRGPQTIGGSSGD